VVVVRVVVRVVLVRVVVVRVVVVRVVVIRVVVVRVLVRVVLVRVRVNHLPGVSSWFSRLQRSVLTALRLNEVTPLRAFHGGKHKPSDWSPNLPAGTNQRKE
jgi:hypothetical protein